MPFKKAQGGFNKISDHGFVSWRLENYASNLVFLLYFRAFNKTEYGSRITESGKAQDEMLTLRCSE